MQLNRAGCLQRAAFSDARRPHHVRVGVANAEPPRVTQGRVVREEDDGSLRVTEAGAKKNQAVYADQAMVSLGSSSVIRRAVL